MDFSDPASIRLVELVRSGLSLKKASYQAGLSYDQGRTQWAKLDGRELQGGRLGGLPKPPRPKPAVRSRGPWEFTDSASLHFVELVRSGVSMLAASREAGLTYDQGRTRWARLGDVKLQLGAIGGIPRPKKPRGLTPDDIPAAPAGPCTGPVTFYERCMIQLRLQDGWKQARIAKELGRDPSVISRERHRNLNKDSIYDARCAQRNAEKQLKRPKGFKLLASPELVKFVEDNMDDGWSPKLISDVLKSLYPENRDMQVSHETIYQCLYVQGRGVLRQDLYRCLSLKRSSRRSHSRTTSMRGSRYEDALTIRQRPPTVQDRAVPGHWEGDLILGAGNTSAIGTLVERSTRFTILLHLPGDHTAHTVAESMLKAMAELPWHLRRSITWDRGVELADYDRIMLELQAPVYFCDPYSPWQRGSNENTNRLLRHWFEKGSDLAGHTPEDLRRVQDKLNSRPRPTLNLKIPAQALTELLLPQVA
ncbi:IS30 family transposase [Arthrobacter sp. NPDC089319]|uniref:IS30 family transposase n=1 Tax=Arthrobacter sp. NPDC089319 TaxID=3155915 RepID=UPI00344A0703